MSEILIQKAREILKEYWGYDSFYDDQEKIITAILNRKNTISLVPTGGGKSLCFQVPALLMEGTCLVISPLIALIEDQVGRLKSINIAADGVHSGQDPKIQNEILYDLSNGKLKLLYISPERLQSSSFRTFIRDSNISFIAVDEAHCISQWGYDFRPQYRNIRNIKEIFPEIRISAFTATANEKALSDIKTYLDIKQSDVFKSSFLKNNIRFGIIQTESKLKVLKIMLKQFSGSGIIYMRSRNGTEILSNHLNKYSFNSHFYHAGMSSEERKNVQDNWLKNETRIIVSTTAFGMGIDKPDVRFVIHYDLPTSMEEYYQEAGRAGRDRKLSDSVVLYNKKDLHSMRLRDIDSFPNVGHILNTYRKLASVYNIDFNNKNDEKIHFDLATFIKKNNLPKLLCIRTITELERYGFIEFNFNPKSVNSLVKIIRTENEINNLLSSDEKDYKILKTLILNTNNLFTIKRPVSENTIAQISGFDIKTIIDNLNQLDAEGIIKYEQGHRNLQMIIKKNENNDINENELSFRLNRMVMNFKTIKKYLDFEDCRQKFILDYFGEKLQKNCGNCDICMKYKNKKFSRADFEEFSTFLNSNATEWFEMEELLFYKSYINRNKNKQMLKKLIKSNAFEISGNKIKKIHK
ncbi:MAG: ATP-dependent DNA helicase RecQ [Deltaproteobacteria bacterium]